MKTIREKNGIHLVKLNVPVFGGYYAIVKNCITLEDGLCLDAAIEVFNILTLEP